MKGPLALQNEAMIDALRGCLGFEPLYRKRIESPLWDAHSFGDGNARTHVTTRGNGPRKVPPMRGEKVSLADLVITNAGRDRFLHAGRR